MKVLLSLFIGFALGSICMQFFFSSPHKLENDGATLQAPLDQTQAPPPATPSFSREDNRHQVHNDSSGASSISPEKKRILVELTEEDIDEWRKLRNERIQDFLRNNSEYWQAGDVADTSRQSGRLDLAVLQSALGRYECAIKYDIREANVQASYKFTLDLKGANAGAKNELKMEGGSAESKNSMSAQFSWRYLGTDGRDINVVWYNMNGNQTRYVSNFAFKLRAGMSVGEQATTRLAGLDSNLKWFDLGTVDIHRVR